MEKRIIRSVNTGAIVTRLILPWVLIQFLFFLSKFIIEVFQFRFERILMKDHNLVDVSMGNSVRLRKTTNTLNCIIFPDLMVGVDINNMYTDHDGNKIPVSIDYIKNSRWNLFKNKLVLVDRSSQMLSMPVTLIIEKLKFKHDKKSTKVNFNLPAKSIRKQLISYDLITENVKLKDLTERLDYLFVPEKSKLENINSWKQRLRWLNEALVISKTRNYSIYFLKDLEEKIDQTQQRIKLLKE